ncbi:MAG: transposase, partial [Pseudomonadota bacterium]
HVHPIVETYAYCLMKNHFHFLVRIKHFKEFLAPFQISKDLEDFGPVDYSRQFSNMFNAYTKAINKDVGRSGSLFEKNFNRIPVEDNRYLIHLVCYIHRNPQKHKFTQNFQTWPYSSYQAIATEKTPVLHGRRFCHGSTVLSHLKHIIRNLMKHKFNI